MFSCVIPCDIDDVRRCFEVSLKVKSLSLQNFGVKESLDVVDADRLQCVVMRMAALRMSTTASTVVSFGVTFISTRFIFEKIVSVTVVLYYR